MSPEPKEKPPIYEEFTVHCMALQPWIYNNIHDDLYGTERAVYRLYRRVRSLGAKYLEDFLVNGSWAPSEKYTKWAIPWGWTKESGEWKIDFTKKNNRWWECLDIQETNAKKNGIHHRGDLLMDRYNYDIFHRDHNVQGIHGFWSKAALDVQKEYARDVLKFQIARRRKNYKPSVLLINEPMHNRNHSLGEKIAVHHLELFRAIEDLTRIDRTHVVHSGSEFTHAELVGPEWHGPPINRWMGNEEFKSRKVKSWAHSLCTLDALKATGFPIGLGSAWPDLCYSEDGAWKGSYNPIPGTPFRMANKKELKETLRYAISECKVHRNKKFHFALFLMDCLIKNPDTGFYEESFRPTKHIKWMRGLAYHETRVELAV